MTVLVWPTTYGPCCYGEDFERVVGNAPGSARALVAAEAAEREAADAALEARIAALEAA